VKSSACGWNFSAATSLLPSILIENVNEHNADTGERLCQFGLSADETSPWCTPQAPPR
jgi:hypothetical protein